MGRTILKAGVALILLALVWRLLQDREDPETIDRID
jgi:hypothetical protein